MAETRRTVECAKAINLFMVIRLGRDTDKNRLYFGWFVVSQKGFSSVFLVLYVLSLVMVTLKRTGS